MGGQFKVGMVREIKVKAEKEHTAKYFYENLPNVFATPFLAGFMERVSAKLCIKLEAWDEVEKIGEAIMNGSL